MEPKLTRPCTAKGTTSKVKRHPSDWEKTLANDAANKGSISKTHKQLMQPSLNSVRMGRRPRRTPLQSRRPEGYQAHEKTLSRASHQRNANPNLREALPHTSQNGHYQNVQIPDSGEIAEKRDTTAPYTHAASGDADWYSHFEKQSTDYWPFLTAFHSVQKRLQKGTGQGGKVDEYRTRRWNIGVKGQDRGVSPKMVLPISQNNRNCSRFMNTGSRSPGLEGHGENPLIISTVCVKEPQAVLQAGGTRLATSCLQSMTWNSLPGLSSGNWGLFGLLQESFFL